MTNELPDVHFGSAASPLADWRDEPDDDSADDDEELAETPPDVVAMLGFDPKTEMTPAKAAQDGIAFDRSSMRSKDQDGHLFVEMTPISKANICPYWGREIPGADTLGLDPDKQYRLFRDPVELAKGALTFAGKPLMLMHTPVSADEHPREVVVGAVGDDVQFEAPYLKAPLSIWDGEAIGLIESGRQKELSCAYHYKPDMTPGVYGGQSYDGRMTEIAGNHVAIVSEGRAGPDVIVGDSAISIEKDAPMATNANAFSRQALLASGAILAYLPRKLAADSKLGDFRPALAGVTAKTWKADKPKIVSAIKVLTKGKLAADADLDDMHKLLDSLDPEEGAADTEPNAAPPAGKARDEDIDGKRREFLKGKLSAEDMKAFDELDDQEAMDEDESEEERKKRDAKEATDKDARDAEMKDMVTKKAMDAAISTAVKAAQDGVLKAQRDIRDAEEDVRPYVGKLAIAHDSAEAVYRTALGTLGVQVDGVHPSALKVILKSQPVPGAAAKSETVAMDAAGINSFHELFPEAKTHPVKTL